MAITKARTSSPVRGYYVTTINTGRLVQSSGSGFGLPRLGGLINAQVEGLSGGGTGLARLAAQRPESAKHAQKEELKQHEEWKSDIKSEIVKDPETGSPRVVAKDKVPAEALDHPVVPKAQEKKNA